MWGTDDGVHGCPRSGDENDDGRSGTSQDDWHAHLGAGRGVLARDRRGDIIVRSD